jgi:hypothetical protein
MRRQGNGDGFGSKTLWLTAAVLAVATAAVLAAAWTAELQANDIGKTPGTLASPAQTLTKARPEPQTAAGQDHQNAEMLARELATTKHDLDVLVRLLNRACDAGQADREAAELRKALQEEHDRTERLEQDLAAARGDVETQTKLATNAGADASQLKKTAEADAADLRQALQQERDRASRLEQDLGAARRDVETQTKLATKAGADASQLKNTADAGAADLRKSLQQERDRASRLEQDLAAARRDIETQTKLAAKAGTEATQLKKTAEADATDLRKALQQERDRASRLEQDLGAARRDVETQTKLATKAGTEASQLKKTADAGAADLRKSLQQERDRASRLEQDLAAARRDVETQTKLATKAGAEGSQLKKTAEADAADLRKSLQQERDRASRLEQDLAAARRDVETQTKLATKANDEAARFRRATESGSAELRQSLQQERDGATQLERDLALVRSNAPAPTMIATERINTQRGVEAAKPVAAEQPTVADARPKAEDAEETARLVAYARVLLGRGDIGSARIVLQRAVEMSSAEASFALAETYDPLVLSKWGTYGTRGDVTRALDFYARALAGGIKEAKERSDALHR